MKTKQEQIEKKTNLINTIEKLIRVEDLKVMVSEIDFATSEHNFDCAIDKEYKDMKQEIIDCFLHILFVEGIVETDCLSKNIRNLINRLELVY